MEKEEQPNITIEPIQNNLTIGDVSLSSLDDLPTIISYFKMMLLDEDIKKFLDVQKEIKQLNKIKPYVD